MCLMYTVFTLNIVKSIEITNHFSIAKLAKSNSSASLTDKTDFAYDLDQDLVLLT